MTLLELSGEYKASGDRIAQRLQDLRRQYRQSADADERERLKRRIADLRPLLQQCREIERLTQHYYDRSYHRDEKYCL